MASLVADYGSDEESSEEFEQTNEPHPVQPEEAGTNYLIPDEDGGSDSDETDTQASTEKLPNPMAQKLPGPKIRKIKKKDKNVQRTAASIFTNQYAKAEMAKQSLLEKHVKMTESENPSGKKQKICRKFKQGKCRFGKNCKYSHNLDANLSLRYTQEDGASNVEENNETKHNNPRLPPPPKSQGFMGTYNSLQSSSGPKYSHQQMRNFHEQERHMINPDDEDVDDRGIAEDKRKRRIGMSQSLVPPKKAMSNLTKQRMEERPWTFNKK